MLDLLFLVHNRKEFTRKAFGQLLYATDWTLVDRLIIYDDDSTDGVSEEIEHLAPVGAEIRRGLFGGPVAVMKHYLENEPAEMFAKIDSDSVVPDRWLNDCLCVMGDCPELDLLGIEAVHEIGKPVSYKQADYIGGIGLMRSRCFTSMPEPNGRFGFTSWQDKNPDVRKGWLFPSLPVVLLDRVPVDPWKSLSESYECNGWQRPWPKYAPDDPRWTWIL